MSDNTLEITPEIQSIIDAAVAKEVTGLKTKNSELIQTNKTLKTDLDGLKSQFEGFDIEAVKGLLAKASKDEDTRLIAEGKIDEVLSKRTERMQAEYAKQVKAEQEARARAEGKASKLSARTLAGALRDAAIKTGALPEAMDDIVLRAGSVWRLNDDGEPVAVNGDEVILGKDGKTPLSPMEWAESLRETAPHLWPKAQGTNAPGSGSGPRGSKTTGKVDGTPEERAAYFKSKYPDLA